MNRRRLCTLPLLWTPAADAGWLDLFNGVQLGQKADTAGLHYPLIQPPADCLLTMLYFWATWCGPCKVSIPALNTLQTTRAKQGLTIVAVTSETEADVARFAAAVPMVMAVGLDRERRLFKSLGIRAVPYLVLVGRGNAVRWSGQHDELSDAVLDGLLTAAKQHGG